MPHSRGGEWSAVRSGTMYTPPMCLHAGTLRHLYKIHTYVPTYSCNTNTITRQAHSHHTHNFNTASKQANLPVLQALTGECGFLAANLYARSIFGEDALANLSIERLPGSAEGTPVTGHIRIRAKSQVRVCVCVHVCVCLCVCVVGASVTVHCVVLVCSRMH